VSAFDVIVLDTTAPIVTWGQPVDANASETMTVPYLVNEPGIETAEIELLDGRVLAMAVGAGVLTVTLPDDAPEGLATVRAYVVDDVGNRAVRELPVAVSGVIVTQPPPVVPEGFPHPPVVAPVLVRIDGGRAQTGSRYTVNVLAYSSSRAGIRTAYSVPGTRVVATLGRATLRTSWTLTATPRASSSAASTREITAIHKRPEGPSAEEDLLLLGLL
jgi:hypothetical protein